MPHNRRDFMKAMGMGALGLSLHPDAYQPTMNASRSDILLVYVGTYTSGASEGIYRFRLDLSNGTLYRDRLAARTPQPSFLAIGPRQRYLYAVNETTEYEGEASGSVSAYAIDPRNGNLTFLNRQPSMGGAPCHLIVDPTGKWVLVANYVGGNVAVLPVQEDGSLGEPQSIMQHEGSGPDARRQEGPHAHSITLDASGRFAFAADLGIDRLMAYRLDPKQGTLTPNMPPWTEVKGGSGPRHFAFHPNQKFAYVIQELDSTMTAFSYDAKKGKLTALHTLSTLPEDFSGGNSTADVHVSPDGRFVYGSNRGHDSIVIFRIDQETGRLTYVGHESTKGETPRNFAIDPTGTYLLVANQNSNTIVVFRIDGRTGRLTPTGRQVKAPTPVCLKLMRLNG